MIAKHESPKVRLPNRLPSRPSASSMQLPTERSNGDDEEHEVSLDNFSCTYIICVYHDTYFHNATMYSRTSRRRVCGTATSPSRCL